MKRHPLSLFFVLAFALPWLVWGTTIAQNSGLISWHIPQSLAFWLGLPIASYGAAALTGGWPAIKDLLVRLIRVKVNVVWYATALVLPVVLVVCAMGIGLVLDESPAIGVAVPVSAVLGLLAFNAWMWLLTEETAWRGFALPRLQTRFNPLTASLILGVLWALWHLPLFFIADSFQAQIPFIGFFLSTVATSVVIGWLFNRARGSVLIAALFHATTDVSIAFSAVMSSGQLLFWVFVTLQIIAAAAVARDLARLQHPELFPSPANLDQEHPVAPHPDAAKVIG
jgi:CAAX protease family protein